MSDVAVVSTGPPPSGPGSAWLMSLTTPRIGIPVVVLAALLLVAPVCAKSGGLIATRTAAYATARDVVLEVQADNTVVNIRGSAGRQIEVTATLRNSERIDYVVQPFGTPAVERLIVWAKIDDQFEDRASAVLDITVPWDTRLEVDVGRGEINVTGPVVGDAVLKVDNGRVRVEKATSSYSIETRSGDIHVEDLKGTLNARSEVGAITASGVFLPSLPNRLETVHGDVEVTLYGEPDVRLKGATANGRIDAAGVDGLEVVGNRQVSGTLGPGAATLEISVENGSIAIRTAP